VSVPPWLTALGIPEKCVSNSSSAEEKGRRFSIHPQPGDEIWRVHVDGCWVRDNVKRVDYLFWGRSASSRQVILLVELKGQDFGGALQQIESTLQRLCRRSGSNIIHTGHHRASPGHELHGTGGVRATKLTASSGRSTSSISSSRSTGRVGKKKRNATGQTQKLSPEPIC
jgi:hypothetical protein